MTKETTINENIIVTIEELDREMKNLEKRMRLLKRKKREILRNTGLSHFGFKNLKIDLKQIDDLKQDIICAHSFTEIAKKHKVMPKTIRHWIELFKLQSYVDENEKLTACIKKNKLLSEKLLTYHQNR